ncbi:hypothetical protein RhiTH_011710, partial [Rhizoctonia solani]
MPLKLQNTFSKWTHNEFHGINTQLMEAAPCSFQEILFNGNATLTYNMDLFANLTGASLYKK